MSILQDILATGHVEQELLDALDEEQKAMLFIQMRQEQVRKWQQAEEELERNPPQHKPKKKSLRWLLGTDNDIWTWVMGDHQDDRTIDEILEAEAREKAHTIARLEVGEAPVDSAEEELLKAQLGSIRLGTGITDSMYDDADAFFASPPLLFRPPAPAKGILSSRLAQQPGLVTSTLSYGGGPSPIPAPSPVTTATVSSYNTPIPQTAVFGTRNGNGTNGNGVEKPPVPIRPKGLVAGRPPAELNHLLDPNMPESDWQRTMAANGVKMRTPKSMSPEEKSEEIRKRESELLQKYQEERERLQNEAEVEAEKERIAWEQQEAKAREAEAAIRSIAQRAREQHRALQLRTSTSILPALKDTKAASLREAIKSLPRPPKPKNRQIDTPPGKWAIIEWFRREELPRGTGLDPKTKAPAPWFHGIISRDEAEALLSDKPTGSFLVRVSERIWGYTVSYVVAGGKWKHFLVEKILDGYQFLGTNQVVHEQLFDLVSYHESAPITAKGNEILKWAVGQTRRPPDYADLLPADMIASNGSPARGPFRF